MQKALRDYKLVGFNNNLRFLKRVFDNPVFQQGDYDTGFIEQNISTLLQKSGDVDIFNLVTAVVARSVEHASKIKLPNELIGYRNVKNQK
jgi:acetyl/propionyl-CoA carboxylase alpha subunit